MNCREGDIALYVGRECPEIVGRIFKIVGKYPSALPAWFIEPSVVDRSGKLRNAAFDYALRPIRPGDGTDETLVWAGKPEGVAA